MDPIIVKYQWTVEVYREALRWSMRQRIRPVFRYAIILLAGFFWIAGFYFLKVEGVTTATLLSFSLGLYWMAIFPVMVAIKCRRFKNRPDYGAEVEWQITPEKLTLRTANASSEANWKVFAKVVQTPKGFLFYPNLEIFHWLPRQGFASEDSYVQLAQLAQAQAKVFKQVA
jgi:hypothetical protein